MKTQEFVYDPPVKETTVFVVQIFDTHNSHNDNQCASIFSNITKARRYVQDLIDMEEDSDVYCEYQIREVIVN